VPEFIHQASDDQIALAICFGAVLFSGLVMYFSLHLGRLTGRNPLHETAERSTVLLQNAQPAASHQSADSTTRERAA
jgi:hypothetical protein